MWIDIWHTYGSYGILYCKEYHAYRSMTSRTLPPVNSAADRSQVSGAAQPGLSKLVEWVGASAFLREEQHFRARYGGFLKWGYPEMDALHLYVFLLGKIHLQMDDDWGYPYFKKPPFSWFTKNMIAILLWCWKRYNFTFTPGLVYGCDTIFPKPI